MIAQITRSNARLTLVSQRFFLASVFFRPKNARFGPPAYVIDFELGKELNNAQNTFFFCVDLTSSNALTRDLWRSGRAPADDPAFFRTSRCGKTKEVLCGLFVLQ